MFFVNFNIFPSLFFSRQKKGKLRQVIRGEKEERSEGNSIRDRKENKKYVDVIKN